MLPLVIGDINCFSVSDSKVYALTDNDRFFVKERIYELEAMLGEGFVKINQSCLVNASKIKKFESSIGGSLSVILEGGYKDYISRRQLKAVKERMGI